MSKCIERIKDLIPDVNNANLGTARGRALLEQSLRECGAGRSILADKEGRIIAGNKTLDVAAELDLPVRLVRTDGRELVVVQRTDLDLEDGEGKARRLAYLDNRSGQIGLDWDVERIVSDLEGGVDLGDLWTDDELVELLGDLVGEPPEDPGAQIDRTEELREKWGVERGQVWQIGKHRVMCGDSTGAEDVARLMVGKRADAVVTDPPYGDNWQGPGWRTSSPKEKIANDEGSAFRAVVSGAFRHALDCTASPSFAFVFAHGAQKVRLALEVAELAQGYLLNDVAVWDKNDLGMGQIMRKQWESILLLSRGNNPLSAWHGGKSRPNIFRHTYLRPAFGEHPTPKPTALVGELIGCVTARMGSVYDPFLGSGTTMVAAEQTGRICYGMEIEPKYVAVTLERMADMGLEPRLTDA